MPETETSTSTCEVRRLRRCIRELVALSALPAVWVGYDPRRIAASLADVLQHMLHLDFIYIAVKQEVDGIAAEVAHTAQGPVPADRARECGRALSPWLGPDCSGTLSSIPDPLGGGMIRIVPTPFEIGSRCGVLVAGSRRADFPTEVDRVLLDVGANQAAILLERRRTEEQFQESQRQLEDFVENASEGLHWVDAEGIILWANKAEMDLLGYSREEYIGHPITEFYADPPVIEEILHRLANKERLQGYEARLRCKDGSIKHVLINSDVLWVGEKFIHTRCFTRDITERKRAEEALRASEEHLRFTLDATKVGQWDLDLVNDTARRSLRHDQIFGYDSLLPEWGYTAFVTKHLHPADRPSVERAFQEALASGKELEFECRIVTADQAVRWIWVKGSLYLSDNGKPLRTLGLIMDITERKRAEEALRASEEHLRLALEAGHMGTWDWNLLTGEIAWSRRLEEIHGLAPGTFGGTSEEAFALIHPEDREPAAQEAARNIRDRTEGIREYRILWPDGSIRWLEGRGGIPVYDEQGRAIRMPGLCMDITERKQREASLRASEERFRCLSACSPVGIFQTDVEGQFTYTNPRCQAIAGFTFEEGLGEGWGRFIHPDDRASVLREWFACVREGREFLREFRFQSPQGIIRWAHARTSPMLSDEGRLIGQVGTIEDVTERKRAEEALRQERDFAESLIKTAQAIVLVLDTAGRIVRFNPYTEQVSGYRLDEVRGEDWHATIVPEHDRIRAREAFVRTVAGVEDGRSIHPISTRHGGEREIEWSSKALKDGDGTIIGVLSIGHDLTELRDAQRRALQSERLAAIGEIVTGLAHESRNALHRGQVCLEMLAMEVEDRPEAVRLIGRLQKAQDDLSALYEDVRGYAAPILLERHACDLAEIWRAAWTHLEHLRQGRAATLHEEGDGHDRRCAVDPFRLEQVFRNILENSLAACRDPVAIAIRCTPAEIDGQRALRVAVRDRGPGLGPEQKRRLFEPFYTTKTKGTGLGMAIARRIVEAHGGRIAVGEDGGPGTEIILMLPRGHP